MMKTTKKPYKSLTNNNLQAKLNKIFQDLISKKLTKIEKIKKILYIRGI